MLSISGLEGIMIEGMISGSKGRGGPVWTWIQDIEDSFGTRNGDW